MDDDPDRDSGAGSSNSNGEAVISIRLCISSLPENERDRCLQYDPDDSVWTVKQTLLASISQDIPESFNYGLYCPPVKGKAGKFLDEDRSMKDYGLTGSVGLLELKYKSRVYKDLQPSMMRKEKLAQIQSKEILTKLISKVTKAQTDRIKKLTDKGVDPNFIDPETGETPLTLAVRLTDPKPVMLALVEGGAHIDFRNSRSFTALHCAALTCNQKAIQALLELGSSTNYQDSHGLTPLYHCILAKNNANDLQCLDQLLYDHAVTDVFDEKGWTPLHQVCRSGRVQILDKLIFYGADMNCPNGNGNTPLHICVINNQEECARMLLFRGALKSVVNYSDVDAESLAVKAGNERLAEVIRKSQPKDVVPYTEKPQRNPRRRMTVWVGSNSTLSRSRTVAERGDSRSTLKNIGRLASVQYSSNSGPAQDQIKQSSILSNESTSRRNSSSIGYKTESAAHINRQIIVADAFDEYANLPEFTSVAKTSSSAPSASTANWKNKQSAGMKAAAAQDTEKEEYENLDTCFARCSTDFVSLNGQIAASNRHSTTTSSSISKPGNNQNRPTTLSASARSSQGDFKKPEPPPASLKPRSSNAETYDDAGHYEGSNGSHRSSIVSGTGSVSSNGSASGAHTHLPIPALKNSTTVYNSEGQSFVSDAENIRLEILKRKAANGIISSSADDQSDGGLGDSIHSPTESSNIYEPPPMPSWIPPPPDMMMMGREMSNFPTAKPSGEQPRLQMQQQTQGPVSHRIVSATIGDDSFKEHLANKARNRSVIDPAAERRNQSTVNSTGPMVTLKKTSATNAISASDSSTSATLNLKAPPPVKEKNSRSTISKSSSVEQSIPPMPHSVVSFPHPPPASAPAIAFGSTSRTQPPISGPKWQVNARKAPSNGIQSSVDYSSVDVDEINSMVMPPPPDFVSSPASSFPTNCNISSGNHQTLDSPPYLSKSPEKFTTTTFRAPSIPSLPDQFPLPQQPTKGSGQAYSSNHQHQPVVPSFPQPPKMSATVPPAFQKVTAAPKVVPPPTASHPAVENGRQIDYDLNNIAPPVAFSEGSMSSHRRREMATAVAMKWKSSAPSGTASSAGTSSLKATSSSMINWSIDDVSRWLDSIQMSSHSGAFRAAGVDGRRMIAMTDDDLYELGIRETGQRLMVARAIKTALAND